MKRFAVLLCTLLAAAASATPSPLPRVRLQTTAGDIVVELAARRAPITSANFLAYVDKRRFDGQTFYRAARGVRNPGDGLIQGGIRHKYTLMLNAIAHEPTTRTGLHHVDGTISMARNAPGTAIGDFFITIGPAPSMDAAGEYPGYAAFGQVVAGMDAVKRILAAPTIPNAGEGAMRGQLIARPIRIVTARRIR